MCLCMYIFICKKSYSVSPSRPKEQVACIAVSILIWKQVGLVWATSILAYECHCMGTFLPLLPPAGKPFGNQWWAFLTVFIYPFIHSFTQSLMQSLPAQCFIAFLTWSFSAGSRDFFFSWSKRLQQLPVVMTIHMCLLTPSSKSIL